MTTPNEELQARLMAAWKDGRIVDMPKPGEPGKRVVGYVIEWDESFPMLPGAIIAALAGHPAPPSAGEGDAEPMRSCHEYNPPRAICVECMAGRPERCVWIAEARKHGRPIAGRYATSAPASPQAAGVSDAVVERAKRASDRLKEWRKSMPAVWYGNAALDEAAKVLDEVAAAGAAPEGWQPGDRVMWQASNGNEFPGTIVRQHPVSYDCRLDDGCDANGYAAGRFKLLAAQQPGAQHGQEG